MRPIAGGWSYLMAALPYVSVLAGMYVAHNVWIAMGAYHASAVLALVLAGAEWRVLIRGWHGGLLAALVVFCALGGLILFVAFPYAGKPGLDLSVALDSLGMSPWSMGFFFYYCLLTPPIEELLWRGQLYRATSRVTQFDVLFAGYHLLVLHPFLRPFWLIVVFASLVSASWLWRWTRRKTGGLGIAVITHFVADVVVMWAIYSLAWPK